MDGVLRCTYGTFGCSGEQGQFCHPTAVVCGRYTPGSYDPLANNNYIYVADAGNHRIVGLEKVWGEVIAWWGEVSASPFIADLEVDNFGQVWAVD